jgi:ABC-2 type transport system ATP-binding protein
MADIAIHTDNLTRDFDALRAVDHLTLDVPRGAVFGFLGPNGAGKTTTIHLLLGLLEPTAGHAQVLGYDTRAQADLIRQHTGVLLEHHGLYERLSAEDNLDFYGQINQLSTTDRRARIRELLEGLDLWQRRQERVGEWSKGMKQKLAVARALLHRPSLIFLDEPTAGFDAVAAAAFRDDLLALVDRENVTVFLTTHNLPEAEKLCSLIGVIRDGQLIRVGTPDDIRLQVGRPVVKIAGHGFGESALEMLRMVPSVVDACLENGHLHITLQPDAEVGPLVKLLVEQGAMIEEIHKDTTSLEDAFLLLVKDG